MDTTSPVAGSISTGFFCRRAAESLACLAAGWWLGALAVQHSPALVGGAAKPVPDFSATAGPPMSAATAASGDARGNGIEPESRGRKPGPALPGKAPSFAPVGSTAALNTADGKPDPGAPAFAAEDWMELPSSILAKAQGKGLLALAALTDARPNLKNSQEMSDLLRLTPGQHEQLAEVLHQLLTEWARVRSATLEEAEAAADPDGAARNWRLKGDPLRLRTLEQRLLAEVKNVLGAERAMVFQALVYRNMQSLFHDTELNVRTGRRVTSLQSGAGHSHSFFLDKDPRPDSPLGTIVAAIRKQEKLMESRSPAGGTTPP